MKVRQVSTKVLADVDNAVRTVVAPAYQPNYLVV